MIASIQVHTIRPWFAIAILLLTITLTRAQGAPDPASEESVLSAEQIEVYKAFVNYYARHSAGYASIADLTEPLNLRTDRCLSGIKLENPPGKQDRVHSLPGQIVGQVRNFDLVTIGSTPSKYERVLRLSEIAFDSQHRHAVFKYNLTCRVPLCGEGGTVVFEKVAGAWKHTRSCSNWIS